MIITEEDLFDTKWVISEVIRKNESKQDPIGGNYIMNFLKDKNRFIEEKGSQSDFILNGGRWTLEENILTVYNRLNTTINRSFEVLEYNKEEEKITLVVIHKKGICPLYKNCDKFILNKIVI